MNKNNQRGAVLTWVIVLVVLVIVAIFYFRSGTPAEAPVPTDGTFTTAPAN